MKKTIYYALFIPVLPFLLIGAAIEFAEYGIRSGRALMDSFLNFVHSKGGAA